jgi:hypothetical protein
VQHKLRRVETLRQREQAELRTLSRSKSTGRAYENWLTKSAKAMGEGLGGMAESPTYSAPGALRQRSHVDQYQPEHLPAAESASEKLQLSSYHQRLAEIRSRGVL